MYEFLKYYGLDGIVAATKADKISGNQRRNSLAEIRRSLGLKKDDVLIPVSALDKTGHDKLLDVIWELVQSGPDVPVQEEE